MSENLFDKSNLKINSFKKFSQKSSITSIALKCLVKKNFDCFPN